MKKLLLPALGIFLLALQPGCETEIPSPDTLTYHYRIPGKLGDGWEVGSLEDAAIDSVPLIRMMNDMIEYPGHGIHSILIVRDNRIVFEEYFPGKDLYSPYRIFRPETLHCLCSVTKTFTSALAGIALREGILQSVNDSVCKYLPAYDSLFVGYRRQITIRDLLTLSSGIRWDEHSTAYSDTLNDLGNTIAHEDPISYILSRPVDHEPGWKKRQS